MTETTNLRLRELLAATADELVAALQADACAVSRVIGDVLILVTERAPDGTTLQMGQGYLVPDYPLTQEVLSSGRPRALTRTDDDVDPAEATVLRELDGIARRQAGRRDVLTVDALLSMGADEGAASLGLETWAPIGIDTSHPQLRGVADPLCALVAGCSADVVVSD